MNVFTKTYDAIVSQIQAIQETLASIQATLDKTSTIIRSTLDFIEPIFSFFPWEVVLMFFVGILLVSWINGISPSTGKWNWTGVILFLCFGWGYSEYVTDPNSGVSWARILRAGFYLLFPVHAFGILGVSGRWILKRYRRKKLGNPKDLRDFLHNLDRSFYRVQELGNRVLLGHSEDMIELEAKIKSLQDQLSSGWRKLESEPKNFPV
jgi:hypothetical protein